MAINLDNLTGFHKKALDIREQKMEVIAGNLANANTPGYKARDIDFKQAMESARSEQRQGSLQRTHENHIGGGLNINSFDIDYRIPNQPDTGDGNTVEVQAERNAFLDNGMRYQATLQFLEGKLKGMKKALSGGQS
ncbi:MULTISPECIES: flagellar basal body rod protein FlgB [unclassified Alteromonas]|uniref:flagellar basal body rod protein FlgB n=1 Tax=unclassified Alteromonas TaxID=2614992 RepID=UPI000C475289|nr:MULTISPECIES: flagellar basal body rod protein FlgB [unclassified Alteromonas]AYA63639.1 flagellar basal body rod protein FlgB [Alteromonas sp. RKMC-009]MBT80984.1 flagellar basal body rod protein FlgB [Alteromonadaceae bacterium]MDO6476520.1 flagellar basal body rod protein FlgB [Alteromonas sp. 1_MG-2023]MEC7691390.1 flagellar basal body rod protein FlgB [Pseudomonadota bacterium]|tara:strand:- start:133 stop:540 length:408 start_codon:yes stop_codon:yes gene_type:complete